MKDAVNGFRDLTGIASMNSDNVGGLPACVLFPPLRFEDVFLEFIFEC